MGGREGHLLNARVLANLKLVPSQPSCHSKEERAQGEGKGPPPHGRGAASVQHRLYCAQSLRPDSSTAAHGHVQCQQD